MSKLPLPKTGCSLVIKGRDCSFSLWPVGRTIRRYGLQSHIFAYNPWAVIKNSIRLRCPDSAKAQALAFIGQAEDYFKAATSGGVIAAKPVLLYYSFLNLAKAFALTEGKASNLGKIGHGLSEQGGGGQKFSGAYIEAYQSTTKKVQAFDIFQEALTGGRLTTKKEYKMPHLIPQILQGHRLWGAAANKTERFIQLEKIVFMHDVSSKFIWLTFYLVKEDLARFGISGKRLLEESGLNNFKKVKCDQKNGNNKPLLEFEQKTSLAYSHLPTDKLADLVKTVKNKIWTNVLSVPPYRKYYIYLCPPADKKQLLPQLLSIYALFFYLGSVTRYTPHKFDKIIDGHFGAQIQEAITNLPNQFLYLMASEFAHQDVTRAAIV